MAQNNASNQVLTSNMKSLIVVVALAGYAFGASPLVERTLSQNYEIKAMQAEQNALKEEVDLSKSWDNPMLALGVDDIFFNEPLTRNQEMQNESIALSQKIYTASKLDIKESIALQNLAIKTLELKDKKLSLSKDIIALQYAFIRIENDLSIIAKYEKILHDLKEAHIAYNYTSPHYVDTLNNSVLQKNLSIEKKTLLKEKAVLLYKIQSIINETPSESLIQEAPKQKVFEGDALAFMLQNNPKLQIQNTITKRELDNLHLEQASKTPDVTVSVGFKRRQGRDNYGFLSFEMPLPIYGRENISIQKASLTKNASEQSASALSNQLSFELQDELLSKELLMDKIILTKEILNTNQKIYENLSTTAFGQNDVLLSLLNNLMQTVETEIKLNALHYQYQESLAKINYLLGVEL